MNSRTIPPFWNSHYVTTNTDRIHTTGSTLPVFRCEIILMSLLPPTNRKFRDCTLCSRDNKPAAWYQVIWKI